MAQSPAATLGERANADLQRIFDGPAYQRCFYGTQIPATANVTSEQRYKRNSSLIEFLGAGEGSFCNTTVNGHITEVGLDLGIIDDPMKGRAEAWSGNFLIARLPQKRPEDERRPAAGLLRSRAFSVFLLVSSRSCTGSASQSRGCSACVAAGAQASLPSRC